MSIGSRITWPTALVSPARMKLRRRISSGASPRGRDAVHVPLEREQALRRAESTECPVRRRVGRDRTPAQPHVRAEVRPRRVNRAARQDDRRQRAVGTAVDDQVDVHRDQTALARDRRAMTRPRRMALGRRHHVLRAVVDELHGLPGFPRQQRRVARDDRRVFFLAAKAATGLHLDHAHLVRRQIEERRQRLVNVVRTLHRAPDRHAVGRVRRSHHAVRFDVELLLRAGLVFALDDEVGRGERGVDVPRVTSVVLEDVVRPQHIARPSAPHPS